MIRDSTDFEIWLYCAGKYGIDIGMHESASMFKYPDSSYQARNLTKLDALHFAIEASRFGVLTIKNIKQILRYDTDNNQMLEPSQNAQISIRGDLINGIRFHGLSGWTPAGAPLPAEPNRYDFMNSLDSRLVVMLYVLTKKLKERFDGVSTIYHAGFRSGGGGCHDAGRAMDFSGVRIDGVNYFVPFHWGGQPVSVPPKMLPQWPSNVSKTKYRLDHDFSQLKANLEPSTSRDIFKLVYEVFATHASDKSALPSNDAPSEIGQMSFIMHPDHPTSKPGTAHGREAHQNHIHVQIGAT
jgi:hypothetical protein